MRNKLYLDPIGGIAGDMFSAAFLDAGLIELSELQTAVASFDASIQLIHEKSMQSHILGSKLRVITAQGEESASVFEHHEHHHHDEHHEHHHHEVDEEVHHEHYPFSHIKERLLASSLSEPVRQLVLAIFTTLATAEAKLHNKSLDDIAFHEVGRDDAIADIIAAATCVCAISNHTDIYCGPIPIGQGEIKFSHGIFPIPAPATAELLKGIPIIAGKGHYEMTTPTGAAIIRNICKAFVNEMPTMQIKNIGYGHGNIQPQHFPNSLRLFYGQNKNEQQTLDLDFDEVIELTCNVDDQPGNLLAPCLDRFLTAGAIDVFYSVYQGKKGRQGQQWVILAPPENEQTLAIMMLKELGTIGLRVNRCTRYKLYREAVTYQVDGDICKAKKVFGENIYRVYPETDDVIRFSEKWHLSLSDTWNKLNLIIQSHEEVGR